MKKSSIIIISSFVVGISIISALVIMYPSNSSIQQYWENVAKSNPNSIIIKERRELENYTFADEPGIKINGLNLEYEKDEPINFEVLVIGDGSACAGIEVSIDSVFVAGPPIYSQGFISICDGSNLKILAVPIYFNINTEYSTIPHLDPGKYIVSASYSQDRASFGDTRQGFMIK